MGHREEKGLYLLAAQHLFSTLRSNDLQLQVGLSFFEIYADELYDLLNARTKVFIYTRFPELVAATCAVALLYIDSFANQLHAREDAKKRVVVQVSTF